MKSNLTSSSLQPESRPVRMPKTWPHVIRNGDVAVKIYKNKGHIRGENFQTFLLSYYASGKRQLRRFMDFSKASEEATRIAQQKAQGALAAAAWSARDRVSLEQALALLAKNEGIGNASVSRLVEIVRDYTTARASLPSGVTLAETAQFYKQKHPSNMSRKTVPEVVAEFIADRRSASCSAVHVHDLEIRLGQFSKAFELPIMAVSAPLVQQWIYGLKNQKTKQAVAARTNENMLRQIVSLFNFARRQKYVPAELALELSEISTPKKQHAPHRHLHPRRNARHSCRNGRGGCPGTDHIEIGAHHVEHPAAFGVMPEFPGGGFLVPPRSAQRLDHDVDADAIAKTEAIGHSFCNTIDRHGHTLNDMAFDSLGHHFS